MGSRGDAPAHTTALAQLTATLSPTQASTVASVCELFSLIKEAGPLLAAGIKDFRDAEATAKVAAGDLEKSVAEYTARMSDLSERTAQLDSADKAMTNRETACQDREAEIARKQGTLDIQETELAGRKHDLRVQQDILDGDQAALDADKLMHAADRDAMTKAQLAEINRQATASTIAIKQKIAEAEADVREMRSKAQAEITAAQETLQAREDKIVAREDELHRERARISALLKE